jgi:hypothetical protein
MANNTFEFVGRIAIGKETDSFKPFTVKTSEKGWTTTQLLFNVIAGDNRHFLDIKGLHKEDGTGLVYTQGKGGTNKDTGEKEKGEKLQIPWNDRNKQSKIEKVAEYKKFVIDLEEPKRRYQLEKALEKQEDGSLTDEELKELGAEDIKMALEESKKKRKDFIHETDFATMIHKIIVSDKYTGRMFKIKGNIEYSEYKGKFYKHLIPTRIYLAEKDATPESIGNVILFFKKGAVEEATNKNIITGYLRNYDKQRKETISIPLSFVIDISKDEDDKKRTILHKLLIEQFTVKDKSWKELGVKITMLNGSQKLEITDDMLTDFQREMIAAECMTLDDVRLEMGGDIYGKPIEENIIENVSKGYSKGESFRR